MTLLDAPAGKPEKSRAMAFTIVALAAVVVLLLYFGLRYYPEKRAAEHFFDALVADDTATAYQLWKPGSSYGMKDFMADWGPEGYYGPVKSYKILKVQQPRRANAIAVRVAISPFSPMPDSSDQEKNRKTKVVSVWVLTSDKSFSFPPG
ncbi:MAG: hypothetical protein M3N22_02040 [Acidobacteriota bacterium]|nr:hypothetical protein [Acidobacteriota bacterium]